MLKPGDCVFYRSSPHDGMKAVRDISADQAILARVCMIAVANPQLLPWRACAENQVASCHAYLPG